MIIVNSVDAIPSVLKKEIAALAKAIDAKVDYSLSGEITPYTSSIKSSTEFEKSEVFTDPDGVEGYSSLEYTVRYVHSENVIEVVQIKAANVFKYNTVP